ncbi:MAG: hypothetical protein M1826_004429 [Phylliscum demangeonii]|nr:MAG: hypothetical protein M1826_004429 [Phylliscum demangeonii]
MIDPAVFLIGCLLAPGGAWAFPQPAPPGSPPPPASPPPPPPPPGSQPHKGHELEHLFPTGQVSRMGRSPSLLLPSFTPPLEIYKEVSHDPAQLAAFHAFDHALQTQHSLIYYVMKMDEEFLTCMEAEMAKSLIFSPSPNNVGALFFAADVCQRSDGRDFGIYFPRVENYLPAWKESEEYSEARIVARVLEKAKFKPSSGFHPLPAPAPPPHGLWRMMSRLAASAHRWKMGVKKVPWAKVGTQWETPFMTEPNALVLERY